MNNARVYNPPPDVASPERKWLFSFTGAVSHPIRRKIFDLYSESSSMYHVEHIKKWYDHGDGEKDHFISVARNSSFCLCPHGYCSYTPRITEVMALGRVPVIIADDWIPFSFEEKDPYYVQVPEKDLANLPEILRARAKDAGEIGRNARRLWEKYCSPEKRAAALIELAGTLIEGNYRMPGFESTAKDGIHLTSLGELAGSQVNGSPYGWSSMFGASFLPPEFPGYPTLCATEIASTRDE
jgi:hypothetical protein